MSDVYKNGLTMNSPCADVPPNTLKITMRAHQQAALYAMEEKERLLLGGLDCSGETLYSSYGVLGDSVGVGKSLMVLGHIARLPSIPPLKRAITMGAYSSNRTFSTREMMYTDVSEAGSLIVVPHTLFRQWADYIKKQTNLRCMLLDKKKGLQSDTFAADIFAADVVLISNTLYREFGLWQRDNGIKWKRVFFDEADTIHVVSGYPKPEARFTWFITASWMNVLFPNVTLYIHKTTLNTHVFSPQAKFPFLKPHFEEIAKSQRPYDYLRYTMTSHNFFREVINPEHILRGNLVVSCDEEFIRQSISLPTLFRHNVRCKAPLTQRIVSHAIPSEVQQLLHGGDITGAMRALGVKTEDTTSLIEAVTKNLQKELIRLRATYDFKASLEYSTPQAKELALKSLDDKIKQKDEAIRNMQERIEGFKNEMCPICYDEPGDAIITPCCSRIFCAQCILTCLTQSSNCPMCRGSIDTSMLTKIVVNKDSTAIIESDDASNNPDDFLEKKPEALMRIFRENPDGRFLVFSRYDNPFTSMESAIDALGIKVKQLKGNKDAIASTLRNFQSGDLRCLLLSSHYAGAGLNITTATHVILLHAMTHEEEKQILGRAYRMGRTTPLHFIKLLHPDEMTTTN